MSKSSQKFLARNRAPRVQIEYDVESYGEDKTIRLPFVMGVLSDLSGKPSAGQAAVQDYKFLEFNIDNFDDRMKSVSPTAEYTIPNTLSKDGNLAVSLTFSELADFEPAAVARQVEPLRKLLEARTQLAHLVTYMDGKAGAEELIRKLLSDTGALTGLVANPTETLARAMEADPVLTELRDRAGAEQQNPVDEVETILSQLRNEAFPEEAPANDVAEILALQAVASVAAAPDPAPQPDSVPVEDLPEPIEHISPSKPWELAGPDPTEHLSSPGADDDNSQDQSDGAQGIPASDAGETSPEVTHTPEPQAPFGTVSINRPTELDAPRQKFRIAVLGDFSGRASRGRLQIGRELASRRPIKLDIDTLDDVIAGFATKLALPIGQNGTGVDVELRELDDLHPDALYESTDVFDALADLRQRIQAGDGAKAITEMQGWPDIAVKLPRTAHGRSAGTHVPADAKLSDFQSLISEQHAQRSSAGSVDDLLQQIVGPYVQAAPDPDQANMLAAVDEAIGATMRLILHHPDFQAVEATWRSVEFLARRIETGPRVEIVLYDVSAEEWAADLAAQEDLSESGLFGMLADAPVQDDASGPFSAIFGLYTLEETPPHAELMARMAKLAAWMDAPFIAAISPKFLETKKEDRHPLVKQSWGELRALPEAAYVGLVSPRFLLRLPYGARTEPVEPFEFEEFTLREGLKGMLWGNPVILSAVLMAKTANSMGSDMRLGEIMTAGDIPFHYITDRYGDQVALPCTERMLGTTGMADVVTRGFIPCLSIKGRNEVRQGSFQALGSGVLAGPWQTSSISMKAGNGGSTDVRLAAGLHPQRSANSKTEEGPGENHRAHLFADDDSSDSDTLGPVPEESTEDSEVEEVGMDGLDGLDALLTDLDEDASEPDVDADGADDDLDALLAELGDDDTEADTHDEMDPELAALLESL